MGKSGFEDIAEEKLLSDVKKCYGFDDHMQMKLLKYSENLTYKLQNENTGEKYVLRVFRPNYHKTEELIGELTWIHKLVKDTDVKTADVIQGVNSEFVQKVDGYYVAVFEFIEGRELEELSGSELYYYMERLGEIMAKLHKQVIEWPESSKLVRFSWDLHDLIEVDGRWGHYSLKKDLPKADVECYDEACRIIRIRLEKFGRTGDRYGLFHSDLNIHNLLVNQGEVYVLDFDDCGFGWFLYDIATVVLEYFDDVLEHALEALIRGYEHIRPLSQEEKEEIPTFVVVRKILRIGWIASHSDNDTVKKIPQSYYEKTAQITKEFCYKNSRVIQKW